MTRKNEKKTEEKRHSRKERM